MTDANVRSFARKRDDLELVAEILAERIGGGYARSQVKLTLGELFQRWLNDYAKPYMSERTWRNYERMFKSYFACFRELNVYAIRRVDVQAWVSRLGDNVGHTTANRARELMRMLYNKAIEWELLPDNYNPGTNIRRFALMPRERFLQADELPRFMQALMTLRYDSTRDCLLMCLFTAQRVGNVRMMRWNEIDFQRRVWTIPRTKNGTAHVVPLTPDALAVLRSRKRISEWVFPSYKNTNRPISKLENAWQKVIARAGIEDLRIHDLRRSHASWQAITGANLVAIAKTLNHLDITSTSIYARLNVEDQRQAMATANAAMMKHAGVATAGDDAPAVTELAPVFEIDADDQWVDDHEAAKIVGLSVSTLNVMRWDNSGPPYLKVGFSVKYKPSMLRAWMHQRGEARTAHNNRRGVARIDSGGRTSC